MSKQEKPRAMGPGGRRGSPMAGGMRRGLSQLRPGTVKRLLSYLKPFRARLVFVVVCIVISALTGVLSSLFLQTLIDDYIAPLLLQASPDFSGLLRLIVTMGGIYVIGVLAALFYNRTMVVVAQRTLKTIRDEMFCHMQSLPLGYFDRNTHGDIMSHYTNDTDTLRQMLAQSLPHVFSSAMSIVAVVFAMLYLSVWLTLAVFAVLALMLFVVGRLAGKSSRYFVAQQKDLATVNGYVEEMIHGQKVVKVFCHEDASKADFDRRNDALFDSAAAANSYVNVMMPTMNNMGYIMYVVLAVIGGALALAGAPNVALTGVGVLSLGAIASFLQLSRSLINPVSQVSQQMSSIIMALAGAQRIFQLLDEESEEDAGDVTLVQVREGEHGPVESDRRTGRWAWKMPESRGGTLVPLQGHVELSHVDFGYEKNKQVLFDVSVAAQPGQKIAFVGATGAGKTTITNLINRFYDIDSGSITYDGIDIGQMKKADLRRSLGMVLQDVSLFTGTVMDNIRYGRLDATDEECMAAARLAGADGFIRMLPEGYDTVLSGDGSGLSQGQRQLLSIARAAVADPPVMILDEATSSIDTRTEALVQRGMDSLMHGRTVFVIAHRLSTVRNSDVILVLEHGHVIEQGNHQQLMAQKGQYYRLYTGAFELE